MLKGRLVRSALRWILTSPGIRSVLLQTVRIWPGNRTDWFDRLSRAAGALQRDWLATTYFGAVVECDVTDYIGKRIFFFGIWEPSVSRTIENSLAAGDTFVDIGANVGYDSLLAWSRVGDAGNIVAIDASPRIFRRLGENIARNGAHNIRAVNVAVSDTSGVMQLFGGDAYNSGRTSPLPRDGLVPEDIVPQLALDQILTPVERSAARLIKMDIEGGELPVLRRLLQTLDLYSPTLRLIVELSPETGVEGLREVFDGLIEAGFSAYAIDNAYDIDSYLSGNDPQPPYRISRLPDRQTDVLFVRGEG